jgi:hypothetical protein
VVGVCYHFELFHHFGTNTFPTHQSESFKCAVDIINCEVQVVTTFVFVDTNQQSRNFGHKTLLLLETREHLAEPKPTKPEAGMWLSSRKGRLFLWGLIDVNLFMWALNLMRKVECRSQVTS